MYDCIDPSPYYDKQTYIDESLLVSGSAEDSQHDLKKYPYGPTVPSTQYCQSYNARGLAINKWYLELKPYYLVKEPDDHTLVFESRFECGNLRRAVKVGDYEYDLILKYDYSTSNYTQWFYYSVKNT